MNVLAKEKRVAVIKALVEGNSIRSTVRMTGVAKNTVTKLLVDLGQVCAEYQDVALRSLPCKRVQVDEIWAFCYAKEKNVPQEYKDEFGYGDVWTWTAICADTKLVVCWLIGGRGMDWAKEFLTNLRGRLANRVQLTSDGHKPYLEAVKDSFGHEIDYAQLSKVYGSDYHIPKPGSGERRYSPGIVLSCRRKRRIGDPDPEHISTSFAERNNLTMRMGMRRFTRLTNAFSKKLYNLECAVALHFMHYNFCRVHKTLKKTRAMAAGIADHVWEIEEVLALLEAKTSN